MMRSTAWLKRNRVIVSALIIVFLVLLPIGFVVQRLWASIEDGAQFNAAETEAVAWVRPLTGLLATLVDAQVAATAGNTVNVEAVHAAVDDVRRVEQDHKDPLNIRQRWDPIPDQIDAVLTQQVSGPAASAAYAVPIEITQSLLGTISDASTIVRDPGVDAGYLIDTTVVDVPEVIVKAGRLTGTARESGVVTPLAADPRGAVALDRITQAANAVRTGPRSAANDTTGAAASITLLKPLDAFAAATDKLAQTASAATKDPAAAQADLDRSQAEVHRTSVALETAALDSLDALLRERQDHLAGVRGVVLAAGAAILLAAVLLWLVNSSVLGWRRPGRSDHPEPWQDPQVPAAASAKRRSGANHSEVVPAVPYPTRSR